MALPLSSHRWATRGDELANLDRHGLDHFGLLAKDYCPKGVDVDCSSGDIEWRGDRWEIPGWSTFAQLGPIVFGGGAVTIAAAVFVLVAAIRRRAIRVASLIGGGSALVAAALALAYAWALPGYFVIGWAYPAYLLGAGLVLLGHRSAAADDDAVALATAVARR